MPKIILITHQKGGVGKSTLSFNLAQNIAKGASVAILDFDLQGSLSQLSEIVTDFDILPFQDKIESISALTYDFVFIDTPPYLSNHLPKLITLADLIIVPTKAGILDLLAIKGTIEIIHTECKIPKTLIVFNMIKAKTSLTEDIQKSLDEYNVKIANTKISDLVSFTRSVLMNGVENDNKAQKQIDSLTKEVLTQLITY